MSRARFSDPASLVHHLLDRYEKRAGTSRPIAAVDNDGFATVDRRDAFDEELESLERSGGVELMRDGRGSERVVTGVRLKDASVLYMHVARRPAGEKVEDALVDLRARRGETPGVAQMLDAAASSWSRGVSFIGVAGSDVRTLEQVIGLALAVQARSADANAAEIDFRTFSRVTVGDSKALERNVRPVTSALSLIFGPDHVPPELEPEDVLGSVGIRRLPQPVLLRGPIRVEGAALPGLPFVGVPGESVHLIQLARRPDYVMSIENYASFVRYAREVALADDGLVVFSGGFPSRPTLNVIARLAEEANAPTYHWGDMDPGGVRIFHHIERRLRSAGVELRPHMMSPELLRDVGGTVEGGPRLTGELNDSAVAQLAEVIRYTGLIHEQEELSPHSPMATSHA